MRNGINSSSTKTLSRVIESGDGSSVNSAVPSVFNSVGKAKSPDVSRLIVDNDDTLSAPTGGKFSWAGVGKSVVQGLKNPVNYLMAGVGAGVFAGIQAIINNWSTISEGAKNFFNPDIGLAGGPLLGGIFTAVAAVGAGAVFLRQSADNQLVERLQRVNNFVSDHNVTFNRENLKASDFGFSKEDLERLQTLELVSINKGSDNLSFSIDADADSIDKAKAKAAGHKGRAAIWMGISSLGSGVSFGLMGGPVAAVLGGLFGFTLSVAAYALTELHNGRKVEGCSSKLTQALVSQLNGGNSNRAIDAENDSPQQPVNIKVSRGQAEAEANAKVPAPVQDNNKQTIDSVKLLIKDLEECKNDAEKLAAEVEQKQEEYNNAPTAENLQKLVDNLKEKNPKAIALDGKAREIYKRIAKAKDDINNDDEWKELVGERLSEGKVSTLQGEVRDACVAVQKAYSDAFNALEVGKARNRFSESKDAVLKKPLGEVLEALRAAEESKRALDDEEAGNDAYQERVDDLKKLVEKVEDKLRALLDAKNEFDELYNVEGVSECQLCRSIKGEMDRECTSAQTSLTALQEALNLAQEKEAV